MSTPRPVSCSLCISAQQERLEALVFVLTAHLSEIQRASAADQWQAICAERGWDGGALEQADSATQRLAG